LESGPFITQDATVQEIKTPIMFWFWNQWIVPLKMNLNNLLCSFLEEALVNQLAETPICVSSMSNDLR
jgi:hypothetical protein